MNLHLSVHLSALLVAAAAVHAAGEPGAVPADPTLAARSVVRIRSTFQSWNPGQPWERNPPNRRAALGALVAPARVLTTAEMVADATFIEFESVDGTRTATAAVGAVDYEANLALLDLADPERDAGFAAGMQPLELAEDPPLGAALDIVQVEENGTTLLTRGTLRSVDVTSTFLPEQFFLTFELKASMQSAASSYTLPVLRDGRLAGLLTSYDSKDQLSEVIATPIVRQFLAAAAEGEYVGFPSLGIATTRTDDPSFRAWLRLPDDRGGIYINKVRTGSAAEQAGLAKGDVITAIDDAAIDRRGYFNHPHYGTLFWSHLIRGGKRHGASVKLDLWRAGAPVAVTATLERRDRGKELVPLHQFGAPPPYLVKGGLIFQELSRPLLEAFGKNWESAAPLNLLDVMLNPDDHAEGRNRVVFLSGVIATPATIGYERLRNLIVTSVNGQPVRDLQSLVAAFEQPTDNLHAIKFEEEECPVHLDELVSNAVDGQLIERGIPRLARTR